MVKQQRPSLEQRPADSPHPTSITVGWLWSLPEGKEAWLMIILCSLSATGAIRSQSHLLLWALPGCPPVHPPERPECRLSAPAPGSSGLASGPLASGTEAKQGLANSPSPDAQRARCWECWGCDGSQPASCQCPRASQPGLCTRWQAHPSASLICLSFQDCSVTQLAAWVSCIIVCVCVHECGKKISWEADSFWKLSASFTSWPVLELQWWSWWGSWHVCSSVCVCMCPSCDLHLGVAGWQLLLPWLMKRHGFCGLGPLLATGGWDVLHHAPGSLAGVMRLQVPGANVFFAGCVLTCPLRPAQSNHKTANC